MEGGGRVCVFNGAKNAILRDGAFAVLEVDHLPWAIHRVEEQGHVDDAVFLPGYTLHDGEIFLLHGVLRKLFL